ncbi:MAG: hypothetical protein PHN64_07085 [Desulfovibrionaceae bacterium]|jgi:hypothetical protein|nr:hypothetical protein [Desulfovibrionaceae bacterium]
MGNALQIRVSAVTWNEDLVEKQWPRLAELAFSVPVKIEKHGVMEMVKALGDGLQFMDWSDERKNALAEGIQNAVTLRKAIEEAVADWKPAQANSLTNALEDQLDVLEKKFK